MGTDDISQAELEEFKEDVSYHNKKVECMVNKVNEHHFLKLMESKR